MGVRSLSELEGGWRAFEPGPGNRNPKSCRFKMGKAECSQSLGFCDVGLVPSQLFVYFPAFTL